MGYDPGSVPIGGGAQVALRLIRYWNERAPFSLTVLGSGPMPISQDGIRFLEIPWHVPGQSGALTDLDVRGYARFSR
ncbi:hypothetical protein DRJ54_05325, partial [Candidatus Acetothermia bacterium]